MKRIISATWRTGGRSEPDRAVRVRCALPLGDELVPWLLVAPGYTGSFADDLEGVSHPALTARSTYDKERRQYRVTLVQSDGAKVEFTPFAVADTGDGDNNHLLCLDVEGRVLAVSFPAGFLTDPREDLNPETRIELAPTVSPDQSR